MDFQERILHKSGLSEETFFPPGALWGRWGRQRCAGRSVGHCSRAVGGRATSCAVCDWDLLRRWAQPVASAAGRTRVIHAPRHLPHCLPTITACLRCPPQHSNAPKRCRRAPPHERRPAPGPSRV